jgi:hypothetical protein
VLIFSISSAKQLVARSRPAKHGRHAKLGADNEFYRLTPLEQVQRRFSGELAENYTQQK